MLLNPTSAFEICYIINQLNTNKSCSSDGIEAKLIVLASKVLSPVLAILFNLCFDFEIFPTCLKTVKVVPVHKAGDKNEVTYLQTYFNIVDFFYNFRKVSSYSDTFFFKMSFCINAYTVWIQT